MPLEYLALFSFYGKEAIKDLKQQVCVEFFSYILIAREVGKLHVSHIQCMSNIAIGYPGITKELNIKQMKWCIYCSFDCMHYGIVMQYDANL